MTSGQPLLDRRARRWAGGTVACCAVLVAVLGAIFAHQTRPDRFDQAIDSPVIAWLGGHRVLEHWLSFPGTLIPAVAASAAIVVACLLTGRLNGAVLGALAVPAATGLNDGLCKPLVHRTYLGGLSYPSGHTATIVALAATVTVLLVVPPRPAGVRTLRWLIPAAACVLCILVTVGVIALRFHYFTDTVAGAAEGIGTVCGLALLLDLAGSWRRGRPTARPAATAATTWPAAAGPGAQDQSKLFLPPSVFPRPLVRRSLYGFSAIGVRLKKKKRFRFYASG